MAAFAAHWTAPAQRISPVRRYRKVACDVCYNWVELSRAAAGKRFPRAVRLGGNGAPAITMCRIRSHLAGFVLNVPRSSAIWPLTARCRLGDYTRAMMSKSILTICAALMAGAAGTSLALAQ